MTFYNEKEPLYLEIYTSGVGLRSGLLKANEILQLLQNEVPIVTGFCLILFASKSLITAETMYSNMEGETLGILNGL